MYSLTEINTQIGTVWQIGVELELHAAWYTAEWVADG